MYVISRLLTIIERENFVLRYFENENTKLYLKKSGFNLNFYKVSILKNGCQILKNTSPAKKIRLEFLRGFPLTNPREVIQPCGNFEHSTRKFKCYFQLRIS